MGHRPDHSLFVRCKTARAGLGPTVECRAVEQSAFTPELIGQSDTLRSNHWLYIEAADYRDDSRSAQNKTRC